MKGFTPLYRKELYSLFASPIFFVVAFTFLVIAGYFFYTAVAFFNFQSFEAAQNPMMARQMNVSDMVIRPFLMDMSIVLLLLSPLLTMRLYAEERKTGTIELLLTYPVSDTATILAKFLAAATALLAILAGTLPGIFLLGTFGQPSWATIACGYGGIFLLGSSFLSLGLFTSSVTQNQIIAAVLSFGALLMFWVIGWAKNLVGPSMGAVIEYLSIIKHFDSFAKGVLDSRDFVYYLVFMVLCLFLTLRQMESYRWRG